MSDYHDPVYVHPQEKWDEAYCRKRARSAPPDHWGNKPPIGLISRAGSPYPTYGQRICYNGGCIREGEWYQSEEIPLPIIPDTYEFVTLLSWGTRIQKKTSWSQHHAAATRRLPAASRGH
jgi:hypothetical protein